MHSHFVTITHKPFELQIGSVPRFGLMNRYDCRCATASVLKTNSFFFNDFDIIGRLPINID